MVVVDSIFLNSMTREEQIQLVKTMMRIDKWCFRANTRAHEPLCLAESPDHYVCTRRYRHLGPHIAQFVEGPICCEPWYDEVKR